jgi:hypothetical protein
VRRRDEVLVLSVLFSKWLVLLGLLHLLLLAATTKRSHFAPTALICVLIVGDNHLFSSSLPGHQSRSINTITDRIALVKVLVWSLAQTAISTPSPFKNTTSIRNGTLIDNLVAVDRFPSDSDLFNSIGVPELYRRSSFGSELTSPSVLSAISSHHDASAFCIRMDRWPKSPEGEKAAVQTAICSD